MHPFSLSLSFLQLRRASTLREVRKVSIASPLLRPWEASPRNSARAAFSIAVIVVGIGIKNIHHPQPARPLLAGDHNQKVRTEDLRVAFSDRFVFWICVCALEHVWHVTISQWASSKFLLFQLMILRVVCVPRAVVMIWQARMKRKVSEWKSTVAVR